MQGGGGSALDPGAHKLTVRLLGCSDLISMDVHTGASDPFVVCTLVRNRGAFGKTSGNNRSAREPSNNKQRFQSPTVTRSLNPVWQDEVYVFDPVSSPEQEELHVEVWDEDLMSNDFLGSVDIPLFQLLVHSGSLEKSFKLKGVDRGSVKLDLTLSGPSVSRIADSPIPETASTEHANNNDGADVGGGDGGGDGGGGGGGDGDSNGGDSGEDDDDYRIYDNAEIRPEVRGIVSKEVPAPSALSGKSKTFSSLEEVLDEISAASDTGSPSARSPSRGIRSSVSSNSVVASPSRPKTTAKMSTPSPGSTEANRLQRQLDILLHEHERHVVQHKTAMAKKAKEISALTTQLEAVTAELQEMQDKVSASDEYSIMAQAQIDELTERLDASASSEQALEDAQSREQELVQQVSKLAAMAAAAEKALQEEKAARAKAVAERDTARSEVRKAGAELTDATVAHARVEARLDEAVAESRALLAAERAKVSEMSLAKERLERALADTRISSEGERAVLSHRVQTLQEELDALRIHSESQRAAIESANVELAKHALAEQALQAQLADCKRELQESRKTQTESRSPLTQALWQLPTLALGLVTGALAWKFRRRLYLN